MYVLVQWKKARALTIMDESSEFTDKEVGEEVTVPFNGKLYAAFLKMRSGSRK